MADKRITDDYYHVARGVTEKPEYGLGGASSPTLKGAKEIAREGHELDGKACIVFRGDKVYLRIPENPNHEKPNFQVMPPLSDEEFQALKADIAERGLMVPIIMDTYGTVVDGHHRKRALDELEAEGYDIHWLIRNIRNAWIEHTGERTVEGKRDLAWRLNMQRRHLSREQKRQVVAAKLKESPEWTDTRIAHLLGVSDKTVRSVREEQEAVSEIPKLDTLIGADGKEYPRTRKRTVPVGGVRIDQWGDPISEEPADVPNTDNVIEPPTAEEGEKQEAIDGTKESPADHEVHRRVWRRCPTYGIEVCTLKRGVEEMSSLQRLRCELPTAPILSEIRFSCSRTPFW
jgi:ParB/Sulfiredoxin domain